MHHASSSYSSDRSGPLPVHPVGVFRHIPHSASVDHARVSGLSFSTCGLHSISASRDRVLRLYDVGSVMLSDAYLVGATGCEAVAFTHSSDVVAFTAGHATDASVYLLSLSTGKIIGGITDVIGSAFVAESLRPPKTTSSSTASGQLSTRQTYGHGLTRKQLAREFPDALAFKRSALATHSDAEGDDDEEERDPSAKRVGSAEERPSCAAQPTAGSSRAQLVTIPTAASTSLVLHPSSDIMVSVRKDGWAELVVPTVGRPLALFRPTEEDEAYAARRRRRMRSCDIYSSSAAYASWAEDEKRLACSKSLRDSAQQRANDMAGYYGMRSAVAGGPDAYYSTSSSSSYGGYSVSEDGYEGANEAVWFEYEGDHPHSTASFSPCGNMLSVARSTTVSIYDLRCMGRGPTRVMPSSSLMAVKGRFDHEPPTGDKDTPIIARAQLGGGGVMLVTATTGISTLVDAVGVYAAECDFTCGVRVLGSFGGGGFASQFFASGLEPELSVQQQRAQGGGYGGYPSPLQGIGGGGASLAFSGPWSAAPHAFPAPTSCGAVFVAPSEGCRSMVVQPATRRAHGTASCYPVLVYEGTGGEQDKEASEGAAGSKVSIPLGGVYKAPGAGAVSAVMTHQLLPRDVGPTQAIAVNPRFSLIASAANTVQWWTLGDPPRVGSSSISQEQW